jgi:ankyrin repeat protein
MICAAIDMLPCPSCYLYQFRSSSLQLLLILLLDIYSRLLGTEMSLFGRGCASTGNLERVKELVEGGANIEEIEEGQTALMEACSSGHSEVVAYLVECNANVAHADNEGRTALHWAASEGWGDPDFSTVKYLLEHGARITERDHSGMTALLHDSLSRDSGNLELIQYLLSSEGGASVSDADNDGKTALLLAAGFDCFPTIIQKLLEYGGAQITDTDTKGDVNCESFT